MINSKSDLAVQHGKVPPSNTELESAILGEIILGGNNRYESAATILTARNAFYKSEHQTVWETLSEIDTEGARIDLISVVDRLSRKGQLEAVGGNFGVMKLTMDVSTAGAFEQWCQIVQEYAMLRELILLCGEVTAKAYGKEDVFQLLDQAEQAVSNLTTGSIGGDYSQAVIPAMEVMQRVEMLANNPGSVTGVPTGYPLLDMCVYGWQAPDLIILAARPSVGKTAFAINIAVNAAIAGYGVGLFSLEMSSAQITERIMSALSVVPLDFIRRGDVTQHQKDKLYKAQDDLTKLPLYIDDTAALNILQLRSKARMMVTKHKVKMLVIDYLQLMRGLDDRKTNNREQEISKISRDLKALAKRLNIPIIALSQLSRAIESRAGGEPQLSDLRESGAIEQDADIVAFITRPDYQKTDGEIDPMMANKGELKIKKHRNGKLENIPFETDLSTQRWLAPTFDRPQPTSLPIATLHGDEDFNTPF